MYLKFQYFKLSNYKVINFKFGNFTSRLNGAANPKLEEIMQSVINKLSLQAARKPFYDATPSIDKIHLFSNIAVLFKKRMIFLCPLK